MASQTHHEQIAAAATRVVIIVVAVAVVVVVVVTVRVVSLLVHSIRSFVCLYCVCYLLLLVVVCVGLVCCCLFVCLLACLFVCLFITWFVVVYCLLVVGVVVGVCCLWLCLLFIDLSLFVCRLLFTARLKHPSIGTMTCGFPCAPHWNLFENCICAFHLMLVCSYNVDVCLFICCLVCLRLHWRLLPDNRQQIQTNDEDQTTKVANIDNNNNNKQ